MIICSEPIAKFYESIGLKVERPETGNLLQYIPDEVFKPTDSETEWAIMLPETYKQLRKAAMKKKGGKKC